MSEESKNESKKQSILVFDHDAELDNSLSEEELEQLSDDSNLNYDDSSFDEESLTLEDDNDEDEFKPFAPPLFNDDDLLPHESDNKVENDDDSHDFDSKSTGDSGSVGGNGDVSGSSEDQMNPNLSNNQVLSQGFTLGIPGISSLINLSRRNPERIKERAASNFQKQQQALDMALFNAKNHGKDIASSHLGKTRDGFVDNGIEPPVSAMKSNFELDSQAKQSWKGFKNELSNVESIVNKMQKSAIQAGFDPETLKESIDQKMGKFSEDVENDLKGLTDDKGNSLQESIKDTMDRISELLANIINSLKGIFGKRNDQESNLQQG